MICITQTHQYLIEFFLAEKYTKFVDISKAKVAAFIFIINSFDLGGDNNLLNKGYKVEKLNKFSWTLNIPMFW